MKPFCKRWPDGCRRCGVKKKRSHAGQGFCTRCYHVVRKKGLPIVRRSARIRVSAGEPQFLCYDCSAWKSIIEFDSKQRTRCIACRRAIKKARYEERREEINAKRRAQNAIHAELMRESDRRIKKGLDPWSNRRAIVPLDLVDRWLDRLFLENENSWQLVSARIGMHERRLRVIRNREYGQRGLTTDKITVDLAERIARAADTTDELNEFLVPGVIGWAKGHIHCQRCGRYDIPHHALGLCKRCYQNKVYHDKQGNVQPPPKRERWARWYHACVRCGESKYKHQGRGVCAGCYQQVRKERRGSR